MNIFFLDTCPFKAGKEHCDKHIVKMILEYGQMLSTAHRILDNNNHPLLYKKAFINHPMTIWVRQSFHHYIYLYNLWTECLHEYRRRYAKVHKAEEMMILLSKCPKNLKSEIWQNPPQCMPEIYKRKNYIAGYRAFYLGEKSRFAKWKTTKIPTWYKKGLKKCTAQ